MRRVKTMNSTVASAVLCEAIKAQIIFYTESDFNFMK